MPIEEGLDQLAREIHGSGRTYSVFDLAKLVLGKRDRYTVRFKAREGSGARLFRCPKDNSLWLTHQDALAHLANAEWLSEYYETIETQTDAPAGNFQSIAKCGLSGETLGPPNYHGYQPAIARLHRERFPHLPIDTYKSKIQTDRSEEALEAWLGSMRTVLKYRPASDSSQHSHENGNAQKESPEKSPSKAPGTPAGENEEPTKDTEKPASRDAAGETQPLLENLEALRAHFTEHHFGSAFQESSRAWVSGAIPRSCLSPALFNLFLNTVNAEKYQPRNLAPILCKQFSGRHLAVFKWKGQLKVGPARPRALPENASLAKRPKAILEWVRKNTGRRLDQLWKTLLPEDASQETKHLHYHDLHWLLSQGYLLLFSDNSLHLSKKTAKGHTRAPEGKKRAKPPAKGKKESPEASQAPPPRSQANNPGLYPRPAVTLGGHPKSSSSASRASGLWPHPFREREHLARIN